MPLYSDLSNLQADLNTKKTTCAKLATYYLNRIESHSELNAFLEVYSEEAQQAAQTLDTRIANGETVGRLAGMFIGVKDVICQKGKKLTAASKILGNFESLFTATALERLLAEDAIILGRLNCDEFAMGSSNENSAFGAVRNAQNTQRVAGGSSGGSAVAVQADLCLAALGSDTGGSVRQPASFCGIVGMKPTYGRISRHGLIAYASSFDQIGTLTHSVQDAALLNEIMAGADEFDSTVSQQKVPSFVKNLNKKKTPKKIAYFRQVLEHPSLNEEIKTKTTTFFEQLKTDGHTVEAVDFDLLDMPVPVYYIMTAAEASSNLNRYDGVHFGWRHPAAKSLEDVYEMTRTEGFGTEVKRRIMLGTFVLSAGYYDAYFTKAQKIRRLIQEQLLEILNEYDFIAGPTTPSTAFELGAKSKQNPVQMYLADIFTVQCNLAGLPAISLPLFTHSADEMPFGLQLMGAPFAEQHLLDFSAMILAK